MNLLRRSLFITFFSTGATTSVQFVVTLIIARLLSPTEIGIFSITSIFIGLAAVFRDFGVSAYLQREKDLTNKKMRSALGVLLTAAWILAGVIFFASEYVAAFYEQPGIAEVMRVLTISFALVPFASYHHALLARDLRAEKEAIVKGIGTIVFAGTCITLAFYQFSYLALAWANVANIISTIITYLILKPTGIPIFPSFRGWKEPFKFGSGSIVGNLMDQLNNAIPDLVLGKLTSAHDVGMYSRANGLVGIFHQIVWPTVSYNAVPYIAKNYHSNVPLAPIMAQATSYLTGIAWPIFIVTALYAKELLNVLYGSQWIQAAPLVAFISCQAAIRIGYSLTRPTLLAIGKPYLPVFSSGIGAFGRVIAILLLGQDLLSFALALCIADFITLIAPAWLMSRYVGYSYRLAFSAFWPSVKVSAICFVSVFLTTLLIPATLPDFLKLIIVGIVLLCVWVFSIIFLKHPLHKEISSVLKRLMQTRIATKNTIG